MERDLERLLEVYSLAEILQLLDITEKDVLLLLVENGIADIDTSLFCRLTIGENEVDDIQVEPGSIQDPTV